jgi:hypothetical protein
MSVNKCSIINLPKISDPRGNLSFIDSEINVPFRINRVYYLYDVPGGADRGSHAHKRLKQLIIAVSGSFDVTLDDGRERKKFHLSRCHLGLFITPMIWRYIDNFSSGSVCLVIASELYDEYDYIRDYDEFLRIKNKF